MATGSNTKNLFSFFQLCGRLKHLKRTGWVNHNVQGPETVSGHMYRMAMMAFLFGGSSDPSINREKCIKIALVHDLAESIVGDLTPSCGVSKEEKFGREKAAMEHIKGLLPEEVGKELLELWLEYEHSTSPEALIVKDLDKFDMIFQAFEYEQVHMWEWRLGTRLVAGCMSQFQAEKRPGELQQFFDSTKGVFQHPEVQKWVQELETERNKPCP